MRARMSGAAIVVAAAFLVHAPAGAPGAGVRGDNLVVNPGFEPGEGVNDRTNPPGWSRWSEPGASGRFTWDNTGGRRVPDSMANNAAVIEDSGLRTGWVSSEAIRVDDRQAYLLSGFVSVNRSVGEVRIAVRFYGERGLLRESWTPAISGSTGAEKDAWVIVSARVVPPEGATHALVMCRADHLVGSSWFDDITFVPMSGGLPTATEVREKAFALVGARLRRDEDRPQEAFDAAFRAEAARVAAAVDAARRDGMMWQSTAIALERARRLEGAGLTDLEAGWVRRGWEHMRDAAVALRRADELARRDATRRDPLGPGRGEWPFPFGVLLQYRGPAPAGSIAAELRRIARWGVRDVQMDFPWGMWEPAKGSFDFGFIDEALAAAAANGQRIYAVSGPQYAAVGGRLPGSGTSLMGFTPWYLRDHPDSALVSAAGEPVRDCDGMFWRFAWLDPRRLQAEPAWLETWRRSLGALEAHVAGKPGFGGWFLSQSPALGQGPDPMRGITKPGLLGHNPEYMTLFREWLREKYRTVPALRAAWGKGAPSSFEKAEPPGASVIRVDRGMSTSRYTGSRDRVADWLLFRAETLAAGLGWQAGLLGGGSPSSTVSGAPSGVVAAPKLGELTVTGPLDPDGVSVEAIAAAGTGPVALDLAPDAVIFPLLTRAQDLALGVARGAGPARPVWLTDWEFHAGGVLGGEDREAVFAESYAAPYAAGALLSGARGFFLKSWSGRTGPSSLALSSRTGSTALTISDEGLAALEIGGALRELGPWLAGARTAAPRYGLLVSRRTILFDDPGAYHPLAVLSALALAGIHDVAVVTERALAAGPLPFDVLFAPHATMLGENDVAALKAFVEGGGLLVTDSFLASETADGKPRRPLSFGLDALLGVALESDKRPRDDALTVGVESTTVFTQLTKPVQFSLSYYSGSFRVRPMPGTEVLSVYTGGKKGKTVPAVTLRSAGRGKAALFPRMALWEENMISMVALKVPRPQLRELRMGRKTHHLNGLFASVHLRGLLERAGALPAARLAVATVSTPFLDGQARLADAAGVSVTEIERSRGIVLATQKGLPHLGRFEIDGVRDHFGLRLERMAPIRVGLLESPAEGGGRIAVVSSNSSWGWDAEIEVPAASAAVDMLTGDEFPVANGRMLVTLAPYQARLLALVP